MSQSGRRKQDYGPKVNFKKRKAKTDSCTGFPPFSKNMVTKALNTPILHDFKIVELAVLEYQKHIEANLDPHFDDFWMWGPRYHSQNNLRRIVGVSILSDCVMTFSQQCKDAKGKDVLIEIDVVIPRKSLYVMEGKSRYEWKHGIKSECIHERRVSFTLRELSDEFMQEKPELSKEIFDKMSLI